jgi:dTDP-glucose 4,6-dehydratase
MNLLLTGCAGFIGINFLQYALYNNLKDNYDKVVVLDKEGYAAQYNLKLYSDLIVDFKLDRITKDINDIIDIKIFDSVKWDILNFASESHVDNSIKDPFYAFSQNSNITKRLVEIIGLNNINKFVHISTDEVYGDLDCAYKDDKSKWFTIESKFNPSNPYSASKVAQDAFLMSLRHTFGLNVVIVRMANQFGMFQHPEKMLPASLHRAYNCETIKIYGNGKNIRQWTPVSQTVKHIFNILKTENDTTIHLAATDMLLDNNQIVDILIKELKTYNINAEKEYIIDRKGHDRMYALMPTEKYEYTNSMYDLEQTVKFYIF